MKVRIEYLKEGLFIELLRAPIDCLSADAEGFLEFVRENMEPNMDEPRLKRYEIRVVVMK